ncbi:19425_t:CDS:1, partial [Funneliformis geosporum]
AIVELKEIDRNKRKCEHQTVDRMVIYRLIIAIGAIQDPEGPDKAIC